MRVPVPPTRPNRILPALAIVASLCAMIRSDLAAVRVLKTYQLTSLPVAISPDGLRIAVEKPGANGRTIEILDEPQAVTVPAGCTLAPAEMPRIGSQEPPQNRAWFSPDGKHLAWIAAAARDRVVVLDGKAGPSFAHVWDLTFSPDGNHLAYTATLADGQEQIVLDAKPLKIYKRVKPHSLQFSADSNHLLAIVRTMDRDRFTGGKLDPKNSETAVVDGVEQKGYPLVTAAAISADGKHVAFIGCSQPVRDVSAEARVIADGVEQKTYAEIDPESLVMSSDGSAVAYAAREPSANPRVQQQGAWRVVKNGVEGPEYPQVHAQSLTFSEDGKHFVYASRSDTSKGGGNDFVVMDGKARALTTFIETGSRSGPVTEPKLMHFSPNGKRLLYRIMVLPRPGSPGMAGEAAVIDDKPGTPFNAVSMPRFSPDSRHYAYVAVNIDGFNTPIVVIDGVPNPLRLQGDVVVLHFGNDGSLRAVLASAAGGAYRVLELKPGTGGTSVAARPVPETAPITHAGPVAKGSARAEPAVAALRRIAAATDESQRPDVLGLMPYAYAACGDHDAALSAARSGPLGSRPHPGYGVTMRPPTAADEQSALRNRLDLLSAIIDGQLLNGDRPGAAKTADELFAAVKSIENVEQPENSIYVQAAAIAFLRCGKNDRAEEAMKLTKAPARPRNDPNQELPQMLANWELQNNDPAAAKQSALQIKDARNRVTALVAIAGAYERSFDHAEAADAFAAAMEAEKQVPGGHPSAFLGQIVRNGNSQAIFDWFATVQDKKAVTKELCDLADMQAEFESSGDGVVKTLSLLDAGPERTEACIRAAGRRANLGDSKAIRQLLAMTSGTPPTTFDDLLQVASLQLGAGDKPAAAKAAQQARKLIDTPAPPPRARPLAATPWLFSRDEALKELARILAQTGDLSSGAAVLDEAQAKSRSRDAGQNQPASALQQSLEWAEAHAQIGDSAGAAKPLPAALAAAEQLPEQQRWIFIGRIARVQADAGMIADAEKTVALIPAGTVLQDNFGPASLNMGGIENVWLRIGRAQLAKKDGPSADQSFARAAALAARPSNPRTFPGEPHFTYWGNIAADLAQAGYLREAVAILDRQKALSFDPASLEVIARAQANTGDISGAAVTLKRNASPDVTVRVPTMERMAQGLLSQWKYKQALQLLSESDDPKNPTNTGMARLACLKMAAAFDDAQTIVQYQSADCAGSLAEIFQQFPKPDRNGAAIEPILDAAAKAAIAEKDPMLKQSAGMALARLYLDRGQPARARSILTLTMTAPDDRRQMDPFSAIELLTQAGDVDAALARIAKSASPQTKKQGPIFAANGVIASVLSSR